MNPLRLRPPTFPNQLVRLRNMKCIFWWEPPESSPDPKKTRAKGQRSSQARHSPLCPGGGRTPPFLWGAPHYLLCHFTSWSPCLKLGAWMLNHSGKTRTSSGSFWWLRLIYSQSLPCSALPFNQVESCSRPAFLLLFHQPKLSEAFGRTSRLRFSKAGVVKKPLQTEQIFLVFTVTMTYPTTKSS